MRSTIPDPNAGETVARAKRTERAEARRRYRAATATDPATDVDDERRSRRARRGERAVIGRQGRSRPARPNGSGSSTPSSCRSGRSTFVPTWRPCHGSRVHTKALWVPILITILSAVATAVTGASDLVTGMLFTYFVVFPAIGGVFLAGFLAPRASWLVGIIVGLVSALCYILLGLTGRLRRPVRGTVPTWTRRAAAVSAFIYSPLMGAFFAAGAAWYRRFLALSSPNRNPGRRTQAPKQRPGDGRTAARAPRERAPSAESAPELATVATPYPSRRIPA